jgi:hypothetical protein
MAVAVLLTSSGIKQVPARPSVLLSPFPTSPPRKFQFTELDSATKSLIHSVRSGHIKLQIRPYNFACLYQILFRLSLRCNTEGKWFRHSVRQSYEHHNDHDAVRDTTHERTHRRPTCALLSAAKHSGQVAGCVLQ